MTREVVYQLWVSDDPGDGFIEMSHDAVLAIATAAIRGTVDYLKATGQVTP